MHLRERNEKMIGFDLPVYSNEWPLFWQNFHQHILEIAKNTDKVNADLVNSTLEPYAAKILVIMKDGTSNYLNETHYSIPLSTADKYFVEFERETDMIYFKMEWA